MEASRNVNDSAEQHLTGGRVARAAGWTLALNFSQRAIAFLRLIVLARLLSPSAFGVFAIVLLVTDALETLTTTGFESALIQRKGNIAKYLNTAWTTQIVRGIAIGFLVLVASIPISRFFELPEAAALLQLVAIAPVLRGFENSGTIYLRRDLDLRKQSLWSLSELVGEVVFSFCFAYFWRNAAAMVAGFLAGRGVRMVASYFVHSYRPSFRFDLSAARELYGFGRWILLNNILFFVVLRADAIIVGKLLGAFSLGAYQLGFRVSESFTRSSTKVISTIAFPAYSRVQDDPARVRRGYIMTLQVIASTALPAAIVLSLFAEPITTVLFGSRWAAAAIALPYLAWSAAIRALVATAASVYLAMGYPVYDFLTSIVRALLMFLLMSFLAPSLGLAGVGLAVLAGSVTTVPLWMFFLNRTVSIDVWQIVRAIWPGILLSAAVSMSGFVKESVSVPSALIMPVLVAALAYGVVSLVLWRRYRAGPILAVAYLRRAFRKDARPTPDVEPTAA